MTRSFLQQQGSLYVQELCFLLALSLSLFFKKENSYLALSPALLLLWFIQELNLGRVQWCGALKPIASCSLVSNYFPPSPPPKNSTS